MKAITAVGVSVVALALPASVGAQPSIELRPSVALLRQSVSILVTGLRARSLEVELSGATTGQGRALGWRPLVSVDGGWRGTLPTPALLGFYPVALRLGPGTTEFTDERWLLRVVEPGTLTRPSFATPEDVARWWVRTVSGHARLVALERWPLPAFDRRDRRLHRLLVVAYSLRGHPAVRDRLGMFLTAVRDGYRGRWRLLEATVQP